MVQFTRLRLQGFKSFTDKTELDIGSGLNGVVGPNGCGKSNLVEALRWVMGENSAKRMRGEGMEDVIFNGTNHRPPKNIAEVSLLLDNSDRKAPAAYNGSDEIEISRKIERDKGSNYRINGKIVRARDVQMFFADSVSGANSPALVSQGRITEIIKAKPLERRLILEDSAGISGLFVRRHEAELKLRAASNNLQRLDDLFVSMNERLSALQKQVRQAEKYKSLSEKIRKLDTEIAYLDYKQAADKLSQSKQAFNAAESSVAEKLVTVTQLTKTLNTQSEDIPTLRKAEAEAAATLQTHRINLQRLEDEHNHALQIEQSLSEQISRGEDDIKHETINQSETQNLLEQLDQEKINIAQQLTNTESDLERAESAHKQSQETLEQAQSDYNAATKSEAELKAREASLLNQISQNEQRVQTIADRRQAAQKKLEELTQTHSANNDLSDKENDIKSLEKTIDDLQKSIAATNEQIDGLNTKFTHENNTRQEVSNQLSACTSEINVLERLVNKSGQQTFAPVLDSITVTPGFEKALSRALGDTLRASLDKKAPSYWETHTLSNALPTLPQGCQPLLDIVEAPAALHAALSQIGCVKNEDEAETLRKDLECGQSLVSLEGMYWRWDGLTVNADAADSNAQQLEHKNTLQTLSARHAELLQEKEAAHSKTEALSEKISQHKATLSEQQHAQRTHENTLTTLRKDIANIREQQARTDTQKEHIQSTIRTAEEDIKTVEDIISWDRQRLDDLEQEKQTRTQTNNTQALQERLNSLNESARKAVADFERLKQQKPV